MMAEGILIDHPRLPLNEDDVDDELDINGRNNTMTKEFTVYEPDADFERSPESLEQQQQSGEEQTED